MMVVASIMPLPVRDGNNIGTLTAGLTVFRIGNDGKLELVRANMTSIPTVGSSSGAAWSRSHDGLPDDGRPRDFGQKLSAISSRTTYRTAAVAARNRHTRTFSGPARCLKIR
jgi:hypothetical protein